jgi:integrase
MAIRQYEKNGQRFYEVTVGMRSRLNPTIRKQKRRRGIKNKPMAERIERQLYQDCASEIAMLDGEGYHWRQVVERWYEFKKTDTYEPIGIDTLSDYFNALKKWTTNQWDKPAKHFTRADVKSVISSLDSSGRSKSFQAKMKQVINKVFNWGIEEGLIKEVFQSPTIGIKVSRKAERTPSILNREEIVKLLQAAKFYQHEWYPIWSMAVLTGCRNGELFALTWDDVDFSSKSIRVSKSYNKRQNVTKSTKAGYWRNIPINSDLHELLLELRTDSNGRNEVLPRIRDWRHGYQAKVLKGFCRNIGITPIRFHDLRACFATQLLQNKVAPATVMKICGWKDLETMARYIRLAGIDESGATESLQFLPEKETMDQVVQIYGSNSSI